MKIQQAMAIASAALTFGQVERATLHVDGSPESDATHTVMLALIVADLAAEEGLDVGLAVSFALVHDLPETYAGDTNTARGLTPEQQRSKDSRELGSLMRLEREIGADSWAIVMVHRYERQEEPEARLVRYADKILPKLTHCLNGGEALVAIGMTASEVLAKHDAQGAALHASYPEFPAVRSLFLDACAEALAMMSKREGPGEQWTEVDECDDVCMFALVHRGLHLVVWGTYADVETAGSWTAAIAMHAGGPEWTRTGYEDIGEACKDVMALADAIAESGDAS